MLLCFIALYICIGLCAGSFLFIWGAYRNFLLFLLPYKEKVAPKGKGKGRATPTPRQQASAHARATRAAQRAEAQESIHEVDQNFGNDAAGGPAGMPTRVEQQMPGVAPAVTPRPLTIDDLLLVIAQMQQHS